MTPREIAEQVTAEELCAMTQRLVRTPTPNPPGDVKACAQVIGDLLAKDGIPVEQVAVTDTLVNVLAILDGRRPGKTLWFNGHMDVVPAGADWTRDPWGGERIDGKVYGRGASDMKGGLAAMIGSMLALKRAGCPFAGKILFTAVADEETGSDHGTVWLIEHRKPSADYAIVGEPSDGWVAIGNRGVLWLEATLKGKASHASRPDIGVNAITYAAKAISALGQLDLTARQEIFQIPTGSLAVTLITGGTKVNMIPDRCTINMDRRMLPVETVEETTAQIRQTLAGVMGERASFDLRVIKAWPPVLMDQEHPLVRALVHAFEVVFRRPPEVRGKAASTDASFIHGMAGIPVVLYGPGLVTLAHMTDEYVDVQALVRASHIYTLTTLALLA